MQRLRIKSRLAALGILCASLASCVVGVQLPPPSTAPNQPAAKSGKEEAAAMRAVGPPALDGYAVHGGSADAKAAGFADCDALDYYGSTCRKSASVTLLEVPALEAHVTLAYPDTIKLPEAKRTLADLRYDSVVFQFERPELLYPPRCELDTEIDPNACAARKDLPIVQLEDKLRSAGWRFWEYRWGREYVKAGAGVKITVNGRDNDVTTVTLAAINATEVAEQLNRISEKQNAARKAAAEREQFAKQMSR